VNLVADNNERVGLIRTAVGTCDDQYVVYSSCFVSCDPGFGADPPRQTRQVAPPIDSPWVLESQSFTDKDGNPPEAPTQVAAVWCSWRYSVSLATKCDGDGDPYGVAQAFCGSP